MADVNLDAGILAVQGSMKYERNERRLGATKTPRSRRTLTMPVAVREALALHHHQQQRDERRALGAAWVDSRLVFTGEAGTPLDPSDLRHTFDRLTDRAGLGHWRLNELPLDRRSQPAGPARGDLRRPRGTPPPAAPSSTAATGCDRRSTRTRRSWPTWGSGPSVLFGESRLSWAFFVRGRERTFMNGSALLQSLLQQQD